MPALRPAALSRRAFTLIEVLVVISIIALLIAILLPALGPARDAARRAACSVNMRSCGQAIELYKNQWKEVFPLARYMPQPWLSGSKYPALNVAMADQLDRESPAYRCPGDRIIWKVTFKDDSVTPPVDKISGMSYTYVTALAGETIENAFTSKYLKMTPSNTPLLYDFDNGTYETQDKQQIQTPFFHRTRNVLFADGHASRYDSEGHVE
ncbi:MAG: prepilin-type N-terminal cleavage/methylation domain-containing protein [Phycisphaerales bacterium]|nr:prepilin-type N-terminal cleavage/methylation domain-containing protein [Planctomycetota bacterium]